ncbi:ferredoxin [Candidatus Falkowbacteria bacterium RBG_13_39_14]|uniref:Ferredoxin n=1 Tax=Candidatus Falkowbacteria bacterium RBG_13_39_14 TaxID=1797985 RepID=A0A1F5S5N5_9BACT|nr:MAG: ferredoxin [Candidatus Falkowbacteria bacterium RBG_13_39_14]
MKLSIDKNACVQCGTCKAVCPEVFDLDEEGKAYALESADLEKFGEKAKEAAEMCPAQAIKIGE